MQTAFGDVDITTKQDLKDHQDSCFKLHIKPIMEEIKNLSEQNKQILIELAGLPDKLLIRTDIRYADKKTEKNVDKLIWIVIGSVVLAVLALVFKK